MIKIAKILKPQGLNGEIKVECFTLDLDFWRNLKIVHISGQNYTVNNVRFYKKFGYLTLANVSSVDEAERFRNQIIYVPKENIDTKDDEFLVEDLENCEIVDEFGKFVGVVEAVERYSSVSIINYLAGGARRSFPFLKVVIKRVDVSAKKIVVFKEKLKEVTI